MPANDGDHRLVHRPWTPTDQGTLNATHAVAALPFRPLAGVDAAADPARGAEVGAGIAGELGGTNPCLWVSNAVGRGCRRVAHSDQEGRGRMEEMRIGLDPPHQDRPGRGV